MSSYICFDELSQNGRKTKVFMVVTKDYECDLGTVQWNPQWRKYCFYPAEDTIFDKGCLLEICNFINLLMEERKLLQQEKKNDKKAV